MKGKYYVFKSGDAVPRWMFGVDWDAMRREDAIYNKHHLKITFRRSCIAIRGDCDTMTKIMLCMNTAGDDCAILIAGAHGAVIGGVAGGTGVAIPAEGCGVNDLSATRNHINLTSAF